MGVSTYKGREGKELRGVKDWVHMKTAKMMQDMFRRSTPTWFSN